MALSNNICWEVRTTGSDTNGGGFKIGATGTDWSQQAAAQYSVVNGVTNGTTTITSATAAFGTDVVGNLIYVSGGTGAVTADWYEITARTNATTITVDRSAGLSAGTGVTLKIGGALLSLTPLSTRYAGDNKVWIKGPGTFTTTTGWTFATGNVNFPEPSISLLGYNTTHGDNPVGANRPTIQLSTNSGLTAITISANASYLLKNLIVDGNTLTTSKGIVYSGFVAVNQVNCKFMNFTTCAVDAFGYNQMIDCEITGCTAACVSAAYCWTATRCYVHDNACPGLTIMSQGCSARWCLAANNTGASSHGIVVYNGGTGLISNCVLYGNGGNGVDIETYSYQLLNIQNNIFVNNGGYGLNCSVVLYPALPEFDGNAYYNNTSGARHWVDDTSGIHASGAYTNVHDVTLTGDPFTNAAGGDFTLNNTAGAGAAARAVGFPGTLPIVTPTGYIDMGLYQHQDSGSGGGTTAYTF